MSLRTKGTYGFESSSNQSSMPGDHTFASLIKDFESINEPNQRANHASLEIIHEDYEVASSHGGSARTLNKKYPTQTKNRASHSLSTLEYVNELRQIQDGPTHSATELHPSDYITTEGPVATSEK